MQDKGALEAQQLAPAVVCGNETTFAPHTIVVVSDRLCLTLRQCKVKKRPGLYRPATLAGEVYLKLMVIDEMLIVSFKEL